MIHELRRNPLLGGWIVVAGRREERPWRSGECPFCPGNERLTPPAILVYLERDGEFDLALDGVGPGQVRDRVALLNGLKQGGQGGSREIDEDRHRGGSSRRGNRKGIPRGGRGCIPGGAGSGYPCGEDKPGGA